MVRCAMAIFHLSTKIIGRADNRSAVASAAYRAGEELHDERLGRSFKFKRSERVAHTEIIAPDFAPEWVADRSKLWNSVEAGEPRKDAQLSREFQIALPHELPLRLQKELLTGWLREQITPLGLVADVAIHRKPIGEEQNDHAHVMTTFRSIEADGSWSKKKDRTLNSTEQLEHWRASWAKHVNAALDGAGYDADRHVDHRSHKRRGLEELPTIHEGYAAQGIEARGERSWRVEINRERRRLNQQILAEIKARVTQAANAVSRAAAAVADSFQQLGRGPGETAPKSTPKPAPPPVWQPKPMQKPDKLAEGPPVDLPDAEAEKRKKAAREAAWRQQGGGGGIGG